VYEQGKGRGHSSTDAGTGAADWIDRIPAPAAVITAGGELIHCNADAHALLGRAGGPFGSCEPTTPWLRRITDEVRRTGQAHTMLTRRINGRRLALELQCRAVGEDEILVLFRDCTAQVVGRRSRRSGEHHLRGFLDRLPEAALIEQDGVIVYSNQALARMAGAAHTDNVRGMPLTRILPAAVCERIARLAEGTDPLDGVLEVTLELVGGPRTLEVLPLPMRYRRRQALQLILRDRTEQRQAEENLRRSEEQLKHSQKMDAIGRLASGVAHDFNNLITAIQGHVQFVLEDLPPDSPVREDAIEIRQAADRATELTRQLLTFARRQTSEPRPVNLNAVVAEIEKLLRRLLRADLRLETSLSQGLPDTVADRGELEQIIVNLVVNARDAMPSGGSVTIRTSTLDFDESYNGRNIVLEPGRYVVLTVTDTGCGMSAEVQRRVFEPFFTTKADGTGLGLATAFGIVQQSGGQISMYSEENVGTTFKVFLPALSGSSAETGPTSAPLVHRNGGTGRVLLVDDDDAVRTLVARVLRGAGYDVVAATSAVEAMELLDSSTSAVDVLVTDVMMPGMSGDRFADKLCARFPDAGVVLMSGFPEASLPADLVHQQRERFLEKPFTPTHLLSAVRELMG
jgi:two-component system, cell cycle sensor histidine kinase and response regulator CckA